jgi:LDH2 family malate/lactate/ureidoglycolate dehydrogenase
MTVRYSCDALTQFASTLLERAGLDAPIAADVATVLVEGDLLGHDTHGLALLAPYLAEIDKGGMARTGSYETVNERGASALWDGKRLPGPWLVLRAMDTATRMAREHGTGTVVIRRSHHIACLAAYLKRATDQGLVMELICSDPNTASVAPFGGTQAGHKGYGLALLVEALTGGLAGFGRADPPEGWGATVFVQIIDPEAFAGSDALARQTQHIADACRDNPPRSGAQPVRLPGDKGLAKRREQLESGLALNPEILPALQSWADRLVVAMPAPAPG